MSAGYVVGIFLRLLGGEPAFGIKAAIHYPGFDHDLQMQRFPFKTLTMIVSFTLIIVVSYPMKYLFEKHILPKDWDIFQCIVNIPEEMIVLREPESMNGEVTAINIKRNAPDADGQINPMLKLTCGDFLLPTANYMRLQVGKLS